MGNNNDNEEISEEGIERLVLQRSLLKQQSKFNEADAIYRKLLRLGIRIFDAKDQPSVWKRVEKPVKRRVVWSRLESLITGVVGSNNACTHQVHQTVKQEQQQESVPLVICTVDNAHYRDRYDNTMKHVEKEWQPKCHCCESITAGDYSNDKKCKALRTERCYLLNLKEHPSIGVKKIVMEGWRRNLIPFLLENYSEESFVFVAEDDIRFPDHIPPCRLVQICNDIFAQHPSIQILSLGHSWKELCNTRKNSTEHINLLDYLQRAKGAGVHGATLFAIRDVKAMETMFEAAAAKNRLTHLDQFLFHSVYHNLELALCDPPLVGWAEVDTTLTKSPSGHIRRGGGRLGFLPPPPALSSTYGDHDDDGSENGEYNRIVWIKREVAMA